jgi:hypothetical protein
VSRSLTVSLPAAGTLVRVAVGLVIVVVLAFVGYRTGAALTSRGPILDLASAAPLQQVRTTSDIYLGKIVSVDDNYIRLVGPAVVREAPQASAQAAQIVVIRMTADPFNIDGDLLLSRQDIQAVANVVRDSGLEKAYRQAIGDLPAGPSPSPGT